MEAKVKKKRKKWRHKINKLAKAQGITFDQVEENLELEKECIICCGEMEEEDRFTNDNDFDIHLACEHRQFHQECLRRWCKKAMKCPLCNV